MIVGNSNKGIILSLILLKFMGIVVIKFKWGEGI
jgi:hypothetical protein